MLNDHLFAENRRHFFSRGSQALGLAALAGLLQESKAADVTAGTPGLSGFPDLPVKAKRIIYMFQSGAPSQLDLFEHKPTLESMRGQELP
ncbi:MAG: DUF1501 domain-containing protein, partial [Planctomycetota bacterium]